MPRNRHMFKLMTDVPEALKDFYVEELRTEQVFDEQGEPVQADEEYTYADEEGVEQTATRKVPTYREVVYVVQISRPEEKTIDALERVVVLGKPQTVLEVFAQCVSNHEQWSWFDLYHEYLKELLDENEYNANLPDPVANEDGTVTYPEPKTLPIEPLRPEVRTVEQVLAPYQRKLTKMAGIEVKGINVSLSESNQNGLSALKSAFDLATEFDAGDQFFPIKFNAETATGEQVVELVDEAEFKQFGLQFIMARKAYFE